MADDPIKDILRQVREASEAEQVRTDMFMLRSLTTSFKMRAAGMDFIHSFNDLDVVALLERCSEMMEAKFNDAKNG